MVIASISRGSVCGLPQTLESAQEAILLPEVQEMLRRLSEYKLGIFMPHMHGQHTGDLCPLPDDVMQVESGLEVSFQTTEEIELQADRFIPVGWLWRSGVATTLAVCKMVSVNENGDDKEASSTNTKHTMKVKDIAASARPSSFRLQGA